MMIVYRVISYGDNVYGISASEDDEVIKSEKLENINESEINKLALLCNREQLSPIHLKDVVEDVKYRIAHGN